MNLKGQQVKKESCLYCGDTLKIGKHSFCGKSHEHKWKEAEAKRLKGSNLVPIKINDRTYVYATPDKVNEVKAKWKARIGDGVMVEKTLPMWKPRRTYKKKSTDGIDVLEDVHIIPEDITFNEEVFLNGK